MSSHISLRHALLVGGALLGGACSPAKSNGSRATVNEPRRLPTGATLDPAGTQVDVGRDLFNRILWRSIKGSSRPYPGPTRMSAAEVLRSW
jgi:hypothetical protein